MKKLLTIMIIIGTMSFIACGPNAKEKAEKNKQDSIKKDSIAKSNTPQYLVLGTWVLDGGCGYRDDCKKLIVTSKGEGLYLVSEFWQEANGTLKQENANGQFKSGMGQSIVEIGREAYSISIITETKKIEYAGCTYSKTAN